ncbi:MAG: sulfite exporter TauE/SafE family protein [Microthrixaceae bacterium]
MRGLLASPLGLLIGLSLGALGGGGSILAVPALVYGAGETAQVATSTSLMVVGAASLMGVGSHWRAGRVRWGHGLLFGITGIGGSALGTAANQAVDPDVLLLAFSGVMVIAAAAMWRRNRGDAEVGPPSAEDVPVDDHGNDQGVSAGARRVAPVPDPLTWGALPKVIAAGTAVGLMTGFFGVGGGFVIVPALVLTMGFSMPDAVGTSLVVIAINSAMALGLRAGSLDIHWGDALPFLGMAIVGTVLGKRIADRVPAAKLTTGFVVLLVAIAAYTAVSSIVQLA